MRSRRFRKNVGIINNCKLFLDTPCNRAVGIGTVHNTREAMLHIAQIPSNHFKVSIDISIEDDALLPIHLDEDIVTVRQALGTFVAWQQHLIDVVHIVGKVFDDHGATSPPRIDEEHASKKVKVKSPADSTISISILSPVYGFSADEFIDKNDVKDVHDRDWIGASVIFVYIRYLYDNFIARSKKKVMFLSPLSNTLGVGVVNNEARKNDQANGVANILNKNKGNIDLFFAPLNTRQHWVLVVINRVSQQFFYFDSLKHGDPNKYPAMNDIFSRALNIYIYIYIAQNIRNRSSSPITWTHVKTPCQNNDKYCGYYVIYFMKEVIKQGTLEVKFKIYVTCNSTAYCSNFAV
ncbi:hypothetical protein Lal_00023515 [Lupinus albus]|nr:hypothetical protein Lal_00023515 [Lupinus albus]